MMHNSRAVYQRYMGWYDANPANLWPHPPEAVAPRYVAAMGGRDGALAVARQAWDDGDYRWCAEVGKHLVFAANVSVEQEALERFAKGADMLVTSHAIVEDGVPGKIAPVLAPAAIARLAQASGIKTVALMSRASETLAQEGEAETLMRRHFEGQIRFVDDLECLTP